MEQELLPEATINCFCSTLITHFSASAPVAASIMANPVRYGVGFSAGFYSPLVSYDEEPMERPETFDPAYESEFDSEQEDELDIEQEKDITESTGEIEQQWKNHDFACDLDTLSLATDLTSDLTCNIDNVSFDLTGDLTSDPAYDAKQQWENHGCFYWDLTYHGCSYYDPTYHDMAEDWENHEDAYEAQEEDYNGYEYEIGDEDFCWDDNG